MPSLDCTLLADGSSDAALLPILEWAIRQHVGEVVVQCEWADLRRLVSPPRALGDRIAKAVELYPCNMLFVHRDAEGQDPERRYGEIQTAVQTAKMQGFDVPHVCVVPVRMQEAWLLLDPVAIRHAADNPSGTARLDLPQPHRIEALPNPKAVLYECLKIASERRGRRLKRFRLERGALLVSRHMSDFQALRVLPAFRRLEEEIRTVIATVRMGLHQLEAH